MWKTILMHQILESYQGKTMLLNGEDYDTLTLLEKPYHSQLPTLFNGIDMVAIDEAQDIPQIGSILKLIVDEIPGISVLASGSSSFDLLNKNG